MKIALIRPCTRVMSHPSIRMAIQAMMQCHSMQSSSQAWVYSRANQNGKHAERINLPEQRNVRS